MNEEVLRPVEGYLSNYPLYDSNYDISYHIIFIVLSYQFIRVIIR